MTMPAADVDLARASFDLARRIVGRANAPRPTSS